MKHPTVACIFVTFVIFVLVAFGPASPVLDLS